MELIEIQKIIAEAILEDDAKQLLDLFSKIPADQIHTVWNAKYRFQRRGEDRLKVLISPSGEEGEFDSADLSLLGLCQMLDRPKCRECVLQWERRNGLRK